jgi:hypothetical protein
MPSRFVRGTLRCAYLGMELHHNLTIMYEFSIRGRRRKLKLGTPLLFPARADGDDRRETRRAATPEPSAAVNGAAIKSARSLVDDAYERATAVAGRTGAADAPSSEPAKAIDTSTIGDRIAIDGLGPQSQETAQTAMRNSVPAVQPNGTKWPQSEQAEMVWTARRLAPIDEFRGTARMTVSLRPKRRKLRLALTAIVAGTLLVSLLAADVLLRSLLPASARETASLAAVVIPTAEAPSAAPDPAAAAPEAAVEPGPAAANRAPDLPTTQAVEKPEAAPEPTARAWAVTTSLPRAEEIGSAGIDTIPAAPLPVPESGSTEPSTPANSATATVDSEPPIAEPASATASASGAPAATMPQPPRPVPEPPAAPTEIASSRSTEPTAPAGETIAMAEPIAPAPAVEAPPSAESAMMVRRGNELLAAGDIISARRFFERAAAAGDAAAACGVGKSFDPVFLREIGARGLSGDAASAIVWYNRAAAAGDREAQARLQRLSFGQWDTSSENKQ